MSKIVSAAFITYKGKLLMLHRDDVPNISDPDCWGLVGGHSKVGETAEETLRREVREEVGLNIHNPEFLINMPDGGYDLHMYRVELSDDDLKYLRLGDESQAMGFFDLNEIKSLKLTAGMHDLISDEDKLKRVSQKIGLN